MTQVLVKDNTLAGKYIAIVSMEDPFIISSGLDPKEVYDEALRKGYPQPLIVYIPEKNMAQIYYLTA